VDEGHWLVADRQQAGRGRHGRVWQGGSGNFMGSTMVRLRRDDPPAHSLALVAGLAAQRAIAEYVPGHQPLLKWPNDVLVNSAKVAGCLVERAGDDVVVGVGVNLANAPQLANRPTMALADLGVAIDRNAFADRLAPTFTDCLYRWRDGEGLSQIIAAWTAAAHPIGTMLTLSEGPSAGLTAAFDGLERDGSLRVRLVDGSTQVIHAGEVQMAATLVQQGIGTDAARD
jgi:BirA family transcriptional regulator, biotin operon repressor / biotin---[acetyl-CoA-carboxylase] ligase